MIIAVLTYKKPLADVDLHLAAHREFLASWYEKGCLLMSGPRRGRVGGVIVLAVETEADAMDILKNDPFYINEIADYRLVDFSPTLFRNEDLKRQLG